MTSFTGEAQTRLAAEAAEIISRYPEPRSALMPLLHLVQAEEGYVSGDGIEFCARLLGLSVTEVTAVVTFYTMYKRRPVGEYHMGVCTNTLCAVMGGDQIFADLREHLGVGNDETTEDGKITLEHVECNAACDYAPVVMVNWEFFDNMTPQSARKLADDLRAGNDVRPPRGPRRLCTWREASRILAGYPDGQAGDGPPAGEATLVGLKIAHERGWSAPEPAPSQQAEAVPAQPEAAPSTPGAAPSTPEETAAAPPKTGPAEPKARPGGTRGARKKESS